ITTSNGSLPAGVGIFSYRVGGITVSQASVPVQKEALAVRLFAESSGTVGAGAVQTGIALANSSPFPVAVILELTPTDGTTAAPATATLTIPGDGQIAAFVKDLMPNAPPKFRGVLRLVSPVPVATIGLRGTVNERGEFLITTTPPADESV